MGNLKIWCDSCSHARMFLGYSLKSFRTPQTEYFPKLWPSMSGTAILFLFWQRQAVWVLFSTLLLNFNFYLCTVLVCCFDDVSIRLIALYSFYIMINDRVMDFKAFHMIKSLSKMAGCWNSGHSLVVVEDCKSLRIFVVKIITMNHDFYKDKWY